MRGVSLPLHVLVPSLACCQISFHPECLVRASFSLLSYAGHSRNEVVVTSGPHRVAALLEKHVEHLVVPFLCSRSTIDRNWVVLAKERYQKDYCGLYSSTMFANDSTLFS